MKKNTGFTLIELLIVIAIIGILIGLIAANFIGVRQRARDSQRKSDLRQIQSALEMYKADNGSYPTGGFDSCNDVPWSGLANFLSPKYLQTLPVDPVNRHVGTWPEYYCYYYSSNTLNNTPSKYSSLYVYVLGARLENSSDPSINFNPGSGCSGYQPISPLDLTNFYGACSVNYVILSP